MKELFTDIYKKLAGFFQAPEEKENLKEVACNRLKFVLMQDRTNLTPQLLERMRSEMIDLLSKYVEMDKEALELNFAQEGESMALMLSIPVLRAKDEEEIHALIKAEEDAKAEIEAKKLAEEEVESDVEESEHSEEECEEDLEQVIEEETAESEETEKAEEVEEIDEDENSDSEAVEEPEETIENKPKKNKKNRN